MMSRTEPKHQVKLRQESDTFKAQMPSPSKLQRKSAMAMPTVAMHDTLHTEPCLKRLPVMLHSSELLLELRNSNDGPDQHTRVHNKMRLKPKAQSGNTEREVVGVGLIEPGSTNRDTRSASLETRLGGHATHRQAPETCSPAIQKQLTQLT